MTAPGRATVNSHLLVKSLKISKCRLLFYRFFDHRTTCNLFAAL